MDQIDIGHLFLIIIIVVLSGILYVTWYQVTFLDALLTIEQTNTFECVDLEKEQQELKQMLN